MLQAPLRTLPVAVTAIVLAACAGPSQPVAPPSRGGVDRYDGPPASFDFPAGWSVTAPGDADQSAGPGTAVPGPSARVIVGLDNFNRVVVAGFTGDLFVTPENFEERRAQVEEAVVRGLEIAKSRVLSGPDVISVGMQPALRWVVKNDSGVGYILTTSLYVLFRGNREYTIRCSSIPPLRAEVDEGCARVLESAEFTYQAPLISVPAVPAGSVAPAPSATS